MLRSVRPPLRLRGHMLTAFVHAVEEHALALLAIAGGYPGAPAKQLALLYNLLLPFRSDAKMAQTHWSPDLLFQAPPFSNISFTTYYVNMIPFVLLKNQNMIQC